MFISFDFQIASSMKVDDTLMSKESAEKKKIYFSFSSASPPLMTSQLTTRPIKSSRGWWRHHPDNFNSFSKSNDGPLPVLWWRHNLKRKKNRKKEQKKNSVKTDIRCVRGTPTEFRKNISIYKKNRTSSRSLMTSRPKIGSMRRNRKKLGKTR